MGEMVTSRRMLIGNLAATSVVLGAVASRATAGALERGLDTMNMQATITSDRPAAAFSAWHRAVTAERKARDAYRRYNETHMENAERAYAAREITWDEHRIVEKESDRLNDEYEEAYAAMLFVPAPDARALAYKLTRAISNGRLGLDTSDSFDALPTLAADARRLAGEA